MWKHSSTRNFTRQTVQSLPFQIFGTEMEIKLPVAPAFKYSLVAKSEVWYLVWSLATTISQGPLLWCCCKCCSDVTTADKSSFTSNLWLQTEFGGANNLDCFQKGAGGKKRKAEKEMTQEKNLKKGRQQSKYEWKAVPLTESTGNWNAREGTLMQFLWGSEIAALT